MICQERVKSIAKSAGGEGSNVMPTANPQLNVTVPTSPPVETAPVERNTCIPSLPEVGDYWKPVHEKHIPKPTEKVHAAFVASSPAVEDILQLNAQLDSVVETMVTGYWDLKAPKNQKEACKLDEDQWVEAELEELKMLKERNTWELVP